MLVSCNYLNKKIIFLKETHTKENIFSVLVGKNGIGKSRLLSAISINAAKINQLPKSALKEKLGILANNINTTYSKDFQKVISLSVSPFDKFPVLKNSESSNIPYKYLGIRGIGGENIGFSHLAKITGDFIKKNYKKEINSSIFGTILNYLGYKEIIKFDLSYSYSFNYIYRTIQNTKLIDFLHENNIKDINGNTSIKQILKKINPLYKEVSDKVYEHYKKENILNKETLTKYNLFSSFKNNLENLLELNFMKINDYLNFFSDLIKYKSIEIFIENGNLITNIREKYLEKIIIENITIFFKDESLKIKSIIVIKNTDNQEFNITSASSGEQSVILSLTSIATYIENNSLILIDEPEICLHPSWQERYIELLIKCFSDFQGCHFILATHSPQIISNLHKNNCYIIDLTNGNLKNSEEFSKKSADYQLATILDAPGYRNEYLIKNIALALNDISTNLEITKNKILEYKKLINYKEKIHNDDPTKDLLNILEKSIDRLMLEN